MSVIETEEDLSIETSKRIHFEWLFPMIFKPRHTLEQIARQNIGTWIVPLILLSVLSLALVFVTAPVRPAPQTTIPQDFQYWPSEQQEQFLKTQSDRSGPLFTLALPAASALIGLWGSWFLFSAVLHLAFTMSGSRGNLTGVLNLVGWSSVPLAFRYIVQVASILITHQMIQKPGLSGFAPTEGNLAIYLNALMTLLDIYFIWQVILIIVGAKASSGLSTGKTLIIIIAVVLIVLALEALPGFGMAKIGSLSANGGVFSS